MVQQLLQITTLKHKLRPETGLLNTSLVGQEVEHCLAQHLALRGEAALGVGGVVVGLQGLALQEGQRVGLADGEAAVHPGRQFNSITKINLMLAQKIVKLK